MAMMNPSMLMKEISDAIRLDNENHEKEAYKKYVGCIYTIAFNLLEAIKVQGGDVVVNQTISKQVKLVQQCTDRVAELIKKIGSSAIHPQMQKYVSRSQSPHFSQVGKDSVSGNEIDPQIQQKPLSDSQPYQSLNTREITNVNTTGPNHIKEGQHGRFGGPEATLPIENNPHAVVARKSRSLTPMEIATKQNQSLMVALKARMLRLNNSDFNAFNYSLAIQRKMMENIAIAKAQEEELARKMQARNQRLEQEAAKRFAAPNGMSEEETEQKEIYKKILEYENEALWLKQWRAKLSTRPEDPVLICQLVQEVLRCSDHPITELLKQYQFKIYQRLVPLVQKRATKLAQIKVPLAEEMWPIYEDVKDIVGDLRERDKTFEKSDPEQEGHSADLTAEPNLNVVLSKEENIGDDSADDYSTSANKQCPISQVCDATSDESPSLPEASINTLKFMNTDDSSENSKEGSTFQNATETLKTSKYVSEESENSKAKSNGGSPEKDPKNSLGNISWERKQAQLLMRQVSKRCTLQAYVNEEEDKNLDYLFDDDDEDAAESMYSSITFTTTSPEPSIPITPIEEKTYENQHPNRSVSHEFQSSSFLDEQDNTAMYQSLPYSSYRERVAESENDRKIAKLTREACEKHLKAICEDIHHYLEKLLTLMTIAYEPLDTPVGKDQCAVSLEEPFFKPIWKTLLLLFRVVNYNQEQVVASVMTKFSSASPGDLKVRKKLWLTSDPEQASLSSSTKDSEEPTPKPYEKVVTELKRVGDHYTMLSKLECVVKVCRLICECVDDYYGKLQPTTAKKAPSIGADDLVPILCYVIIQSAMPQLASECSAMAEFIQEGYLMGEEGYCLTTLRTSLSYVTSMYSSI